MTNLPTIQVRSVVVGKWLDNHGEWQERSITLPANITGERLAIMRRAAAYADTGVLRWLLRLPVYAASFEVMLSAGDVIHQKGEGEPFACGTLPNKEGAPLTLPLSEALATIIGENGKERYPRPCRVCFAKGLLVAKDPQP